MPRPGAGQAFVPPNWESHGGQGVVPGESGWPGGAGSGPELGLVPEKPTARGLPRAARTFEISVETEVSINDL